MCGIAGFYHHPCDQALEQRVLDLLRHRGPDDQRVFRHNQVTLLHARLSIIDLSEGGAQPYRFENLALVFNGVIYNYKEVAVELKKKGYSFQSHSDTEVLIKAFHCWKEQCVDHLIGMFAFAVYDTHEDAIWLFRDRLGVKPLYYSFENNQLVFASELKAWSVLDRGEIDHRAVGFYFRFGYVPRELSIFSKVRKLRPGHYLKVDKTGFKEVQYWRCEPRPTVNRKESDWLDDLEQMMISAFKYRMESDVPVGLFLSGGLDSSLVAAILQKQVGGIEAFTIGFENGQFDESAQAAAIARHLGLTHAVRRLDVREAEGFLHDFSSLYDEPFADTSGIAVACISKLAKAAGMKVVLSADGGDELFGGYPHYGKAIARYGKLSRMPMAMRRGLAATLRALIPPQARKRIPQSNTEHRLFAAEELLRSNSLLEVFESSLANQTHEELRALLGQRYVPVSLLGDSDSAEPLNAMMRWDLEHYLPDDLLVKGDRATMHFGLEGREPLLDHRLVELAFQIPTEMKMKDGQPKYLLRKLLGRYFPDNLITRQKKGFSIPIFEWFSKDLDRQFEEYLTPGEVMKSGLLNPEEVALEYKKYLRYKSAGKEYNIEKMWRILNFQKWSEKWNR